MEFTLNGNRISFGEGIKGMSLSKFCKDHSFLGSKEELKGIFDKLNGNVTRADKKVRKTKSK